MGQVLNALKLLSSTPTGKELINTLLGRKNIIIQYGYNGTEGNVVTWNDAINEGGIDENGNITRPTYIALGHELAHAVDQLYKKTEYGICAGAFKFSCKYEVHYKDQRICDDTYHGKKDSSSQGTICTGKEGIYAV